MTGSFPFASGLVGDRRAWFVRGGTALWLGGYLTNIAILVWRPELPRGTGRVLQIAFWLGVAMTVIALVVYSVRDSRRWPLRGERIDPTYMVIRGSAGQRNSRWSWPPSRLVFDGRALGIFASGVARTIERLEVERVIVRTRSFGSTSVRVVRRDGRRLRPRFVTWDGQVGPALVAHGWPVSDR